MGLGSGSAPGAGPVAGPATSAPLPDLAAAQRRTVAVLVVVQAVGAVGITIGIATASLLARDLSGSEQLAGLAQTGQVLGAAVASYFLARLMSARGRRPGLGTGYALGAAGAVLAVVAGALGSMVLLLVGALLLGFTTAANSAARYAAADLAPEAGRGRALSVVVWATTVGAVAGPNLGGPAGDLARSLGLPELTGPFLVGAVSMALAAVLVVVLLRPDPLLLARAAAREERSARGDEERAPRAGGSSWSRALVVVRERPAVLAAVLGMAGAHAAMVAVMVMTPLHMEHGGAGLEVIGLVISVHVLGMFAFAPVVGLLSDRWGREPVLALGGAVLLASLVLAGVAPEGSSWQIFGGLFLLGLGWSFATVSASTLLVDATPLDDRPDVQGFSDLVMGLTAAAGGGLAGVVVGLAGYGALAVASAGLAALPLLAAAVAHRERRRGALAV